MANNYISEQAAIENLKRLFQNTKEDVISVQEAYESWGRDTSSEKEEQNKSWLFNKLSDLKYHNLVKTKKTIKNSRQVLDKVQLTLTGKKALGRLSEQKQVTETQNTNVTVLNIMHVISKLKKESPDYEINFDIKLKGE